MRFTTSSSLSSSSYCPCGCLPSSSSLSPTPANRRQRSIGSACVHFTSETHETRSAAVQTRALTCRIPCWPAGDQQRPGIEGSLPLAEQWLRTRAPPSRVLVASPGPRGKPRVRGVRASRAEPQPWGAGGGYMRPAPTCGACTWAGRRRPRGSATRCLGALPSEISLARTDPACCAGRARPPLRGNGRGMPGRTGAPSMAHRSGCDAVAASPPASAAAPLSTAPPCPALLPPDVPPLKGIDCKGAAHELT